ncbi:radical SAM/SPASM domain-containing protein [Ochrobactrum teleogrylli]|uniref:Radical SAM protein n=1 Tax=Ochrobactrum teleogrylli TaxID=2479765 RepID=A0ABY2Y393_9HYPH|nr:radical SAM/SPASM domain-containing protein [[Ochrobactrum] teleogrylli]TNV15081.1 radical SAM protein [[Ochrobactrum] teleogrylli]
MAGKHVASKYETISSIHLFMRGREYPKYPANVFLEVSNLCDLKCAMCGPFSALNDMRLFSLKEEDRGFMKAPPRERIENILRHALRIQVFGYGEPTLNPDFLDFLDLAGEYETLISFFSNGMHFSDVVVNKIIESRVHEITISFSGSTKEDYEAVYMGGVWETVLAGLKLISDRKKERGTSYPIISVNSLAYRHHVETLDRFVDVMGDAGVGVIYLKPLVPVPTVPVLGQHASIFRHWVEGPVIERAIAKAKERGIIFNADLYFSGGATDEDHYKKKMRALQRGFGLNPDDLPPALPIIELREIAKSVTPKKPARVTVTEISGNDLALLSARPLKADGMYCLEPFNTMYIGRNLDVKPCCNAPSTTRFDSVKGKTGEDVWGGSAYYQTRKAILRGEYPNFCVDCIKGGNAYAEHNFADTVATYGTWYTEVFKDDFNCTPLDTLLACGDNRNIASRWRYTQHIRAFAGLMRWLSQPT